MNEHLTTSRVHRLLRPLRNKCISLAALPTAFRSTHSKRSSTSDCPPLQVLCPPAGAKKAMFERRSADELELSKRIYAVGDAFRNIVHAAYTQPRHRRLPSLAAMCAHVVGGNMPVTSADGAQLDSAQDSTESEILDIDTIYECVPPHYRCSLIVSHALSMILFICVHHHTLVTILLDHCLSFGLVQESTHLLNVILAQAFLPIDSSNPPPATHPAHTNFLLDLHAKWTAGGKPSDPSSGALLFTTSLLCQAVMDTLSRSSSLHSLWTSQVLNRLFHAVEGDLDSVIVITYTLSGSSWTSPNAMQDGVPSLMLRDKLGVLMSRLFDLLFTHDVPHPSPQTPPGIYALADILQNCHAARLHCCRALTPRSSVDLPDIIIVFATHVFVNFPNLIDNPDHLLAILGDSSPIPTTFSKLMAYFSRLRHSQVFSDFVKALPAQLEMYSSALRSEKLFALDASLWACALHHFETSIASSHRDSSTLVTELKQQLMEAVDAAERRCFGSTTNSSPVISLGSNHAERTKRGRLSGHWEWEDMVGSWIRKTPVHKKRKTGDGHLHGYSRPRDVLISKLVARSISPSTPSLTCRRHLSTHSSTSSFQPSESDGSDYQEETDKENRPSSPPSTARQSRPVKRRNSNFFSLLADAQTNRIVLHPKPKQKQPSSSTVVPRKRVPPLSSQESLYISCDLKQERQVSRSQGRPSVASRTMFFSDDSLDLFACTTSSPARF